MALAVQPQPTDPVPAPATETERHVQDVIGDLTARKVSRADRERLGKALDAANAPLAGRAGQDEALGRAISRLQPGLTTP